jgi:hypothetical protein
MAKIYPPFFDDKSPLKNAERHFFNLLKKQIGNEWTVFHSIWNRNHEFKYVSENDFILLSEHGLLAIEVKGGNVRTKNKQWFYAPLSTGGESKPKNESPMDQARGALEAIKRHIIDLHPEMKEAFLNVPSSYGSYFPDTEFIGFSDCSDWPRSMVWDASRDSESPSHVIAEMINYAESECLRLKRRKRKFTSGEIDIITKCIVPEFVGVPCHNRSKNTTDTELKRFYDDKLSQISEALENPRIVFNGVAGSGKTLLALGLSRIFRKAEPKSTIAVVCYNKLLADWLKLQTQDIEPDEKFWVGSVHALIKQKYNLSDDTLTDKNKLLGVIELLSNFRPTQQFDYLIIDEGQDFLADINEGFITLLDKLLKGGFRDGNCYWFQDLKQSVLRGNPSDENLLFRNYTKINMKDNIRNPKSVANFAKDFGRDKIMVVKHEELGVRSNEIFTSLDLQERRAAVERMLKKLYDKSYAPDDIVLLRYESKMSDCLAGISSLGGYHIRPYDQFDIKNESIKCTTVRKFKGMESRVIIIYDIYSDDSLSIPLMYVGSTRAKHFLGLVYSDSVQDQFVFIEE